MNKIKKDVGRFFYVHPDVSGVTGVWKIGVTISPYTAVRQRQKFMHKTFSIDHLFIGTGRDIAQLESNLKQLLNDAGYATQRSSQTEMFEIDIDKLLGIIEQQIYDHDLNVFKFPLKEPYSATSSGSCPLGLPSESKVTQYVKNILKTQFNIIDPEDSYNNVWHSLFEEIHL